MSSPKNPRFFAGFRRIRINFSYQSMTGAPPVITIILTASSEKSCALTVSGLFNMPRASTLTYPTFLLIRPLSFNEIRSTVSSSAKFSESVSILTMPFLFPRCTDFSLDCSTSEAATSSDMVSAASPTLTDSRISRPVTRLNFSRLIAPKSALVISVAARRV